VQVLPLHHLDHEEGKLLIKDYPPYLAELSDRVPYPEEELHFITEVGEDGRIVIPAWVRRRLKLLPKSVVLVKIMPYSGSCASPAHDLGHHTHHHGYHDK